MAVFVTCGTGGAYSEGLLVPVEDAKLDWSEEIAAAGTSTNTVAADASSSYSNKILTIENLGSSLVYFAVGPTPNVAINPRRPLQPGAIKQYAANAGDKVAWAAS